MNKFIEGLKEQGHLNLSIDMQSHRPTNFLQRKKALEATVSESIGKHKIDRTYILSIQKNH